MNELQITTHINKKLALKCVDLSKILFGNNYHNLDYFDDYAKIKLLALYRNNLVGFLIAEKTNFNQIEILTIGVSKCWQKKSVGTRLMKRFMTNFTKQNTKLITRAWKFKENIYVKNLVEKFGFKPIINKGKIWKNKCNVFFKCKHFKKQCQCECIIYTN